MYENQFAKDWKDLKGAWEKLGVQKPAETKKFILGIERRVSSGIGSALKDLDKADPGVSDDELRKLDPKDLKKRMLSYTAALEKYSKAADTEIKSIESEIDSFQKAIEKSGGAKNDYYRGMKTFRAKLKEYQAHAEKRQSDMEQIVLDPKVSWDDKRIREFGLRVKTVLRTGVSAVQEVKAKPTAETYNRAIKPVVQKLYLVCNESKLIAAENAKWSNNWERIWHSLNDAYLIDVGNDGEVPEKLKKFSSILKESLTQANLVK